MRRFGFLLALLTVLVLGPGLPVTHALSPCTLYTAPTGLPGNPGTLGSPTTPQQAERLTVPGSVVCFAAGTYIMADNGEAGLSLAHSGTPGSPVTYTSYNGLVTLAYPVIGSPAIKIDAGTNWVTINGITVDGGNRDTTDLQSAGGAGILNTHITITNNVILNAGEEGIGAIENDYTTIDHNLVWHTGYFNSGSCGDPCEGSGITLNLAGIADGAPGFHSYITNNVIAGSTYAGTVLPPTDGNGILLDLGQTRGVTSAVLVAGNLAYMNGGRCIGLNVISSAWVVNNSCYANSLLDTGTGSLSSVSSTSSYFVDNAVYGWTGSAPNYAYFSAASSAITYANNSYYGAANAGLPVGLTGTQMVRADPRWAAPPAVDPTAGGQEAAALDPGVVGTRFDLQGVSTLVGAGVDPRTLTSDPALQAGLAAVARPQGAPWDIGASGYAGPALDRLLVEAGLKPSPAHGGRNVCTVSVGDLARTGGTSGAWTRVTMQTGACAGGRGWLLGAAVMTI